MPTTPDNQPPKKRREKFGRILLWLVHHARACLFGFGELTRTPLASIMTITVIAIALALPATFYLVLQNFQNISKSWDNTPSISLYMKQSTSTQQVSQLMGELKKTSDVKSVKYVSPQQGLQAFKKATQFNDLIDSLETNPLPPVIIITPTNASPMNVQILLSRLKTLPAVDLAQLDTTWVKRLFYFVTIGKRIIDMLALLLGIGVIMIVGNTIRLTTQNHHHEIRVLTLVGATRAFIRRPLLYRGLMYGCLGGCLAWLLVSLMLWWLAGPVAHLAQTYGSVFTLTGLNAATGLGILAIAATLGVLGSWVVVRKHIAAPENL